MTFSYEYAFCLQLNHICEECQREFSEDDLYVHTGSDTDPAQAQGQATSSSDDEENVRKKWLAKALLYDEVSSDEDLKDNYIPVTKNVMALRNHLRMVEDTAREELAQQLSLPAYRKLNETVLVQVINFNKRHEEEASHLTLETYKKASTNPMKEDIYETLSPLEKELSKLLTHIEIRGKRGSKVPIFLTERMIESIDLLIKWRDEAGIPAENRYLFARPGAMSNIRGCDCLRKYAMKSKAENPELLRSIKLRKKVATLCQLLDLSEQELEQVARCMGYNISPQDLHRHIDKTFKIVIISKLLFAMEKGTWTSTGNNLNSFNSSFCLSLSYSL